MKRKFRSVSFKVLILVVVFLLVPLAASGTYLYVTTTSKLTDLDKGNLENSSQVVQKLLRQQGNQLLDVTKSNSQWSAARTAVLNDDKAWIQTNLNEQVGTVANLDFVVTTDLSGAVLSQTGLKESFSNSMDANAIQAQMAKASDISGVIATKQGLALIAASKITNETGTAPPTGILIFGHFLRQSDIQMLKDVLQVDVAISSSQGTYSTSKDLLDAAHSGQLGQESGFHLIQWNRQQRGRVVLPLTDIRNRKVGLIAAERSLTASTQVKQDFTDTSLLIAVILVLLLGALVLVFNRVISKPLRRVTETLQNVANGNLSEDNSNLQVKRGDEIGLIAHATGRMVHNLRNMIQSLYGMSEHLTAASEETLQSADSTRQTVQQVAATIEQVSQGSDEQVESIGSGMSVLENLEHAVGQIAHNAQQVSSCVDTASQIALDGDDKVQSSVAQIERIHGQIGELASITTKLQERSTEIESVTQAITDFAMQTNLLALNAAIESARAGEHGRGFAVVAEEVRKLAEQSAQSAENIGTLVRMIQADIQDAVQSMNLGQREVETGLVVVRQTGESFAAIAQSVNEVAQQMGHVLKETEALSKGTQLTEAMHQIEQVAVFNARQMQEATALTEEQYISIEVISSSMQELFTLVQDLHQSMEQFSL